MKLEKTTTLLIIAGIAWLISLCLLFSSISHHNEALFATQKNRNLIKNNLKEELALSAKYDALISEFESQTGTHYYSLLNYIKGLGGKLIFEKTNEIPDTNLQASSFCVAINNCNIDNIYKLIYYAEEQLGSPRFRVSAIELQTQQSRISSVNTPQINTKITFETITRR